MPVEIVSSEPVRYRFMRFVLERMLEECPNELRQAAAVVEQTMKAQINPKTGAWKSDVGGAHFRVVFPALFMHILRPLMHRFLPGEPAFAEDDSDLFWLMREVPDLIKGTIAAPPTKKDHRPRTRIA